ncbi:MAG: hypothetical protein ACLR13_10540 [Acutalibacteraceae bacterium]
MVVLQWGTSWRWYCSALGAAGPWGAAAGAAVVCFQPFCLHDKVRKDY